mmetsp:Transcript_26478/g.67260  ORF Transcript_26478/g.67260 Transcript_26478/m.67260 type:complete len:249 (+) Transcript_26478:2907-3653(+)
MADRDGALGGRAVLHSASGALRRLRVRALSAARLLLAADGNGGVVGYVFAHCADHRLHRAFRGDAQHSRGRVHHADRRTHHPFRLRRPHVHGMGAGYHGVDHHLMRHRYGVRLCRAHWLRISAGQRAARGGHARGARRARHPAHAACTLGRRILDCCDVVLHDICGHAFHHPFWDLHPAAYGLRMALRHVLPAPAARSRRAARPVRRALGHVHPRRSQAGLLSRRQGEQHGRGRTEGDDASIRLCWSK